MFGFHPISSFPLADIKDTFAPSPPRDAKIKTWTVPARSTQWNIPVCKVQAKAPTQNTTWTVPS